MLEYTSNVTSMSTISNNAQDKWWWIEAPCGKEVKCVETDLSPLKGSSKKGMSIPVSMQVCNKQMDAEWEQWMKNKIDSLGVEFDKQINEIVNLYHQKYGNTGHP